MTNKQALAYAKHELEYYKQVEREGIRMTTNMEFYEAVVNALTKQVPKEADGTDVMTIDGTLIRRMYACPECRSEVNETTDNYCCQCGQALK